jgi:hypothetical protein
MGFFGCYTIGLLSSCFLNYDPLFPMGEVLIIVVMQAKQPLHLFVFSRKWCVPSIKKQLLQVKTGCFRE